MSAASEVDIANMARGFVGAERISALSECEDCYQFYPLIRDACLEDVDWSFAIKRFSTGSPSTTAPAYGYANQFLVDSDVLRVIEVNKNDYPWTLEGGYILTDQGSAEYRAVIRITDVRKYSSAFVQMVATRLAATIAIPITNSKSIAESMWRIYGAMKVEAQGNDGRQGKIQISRRPASMASRSGIVGNNFGGFV